MWTPALVPSSPTVRSQGSLPSSKGRLRGRGNVAPSIVSHPTSRPSLLRWGRAVSLRCGGGCRQVVLGRDAWGGRFVDPSPSDNENGIRLNPFGRMRGSEGPFPRGGEDPDPTSPLEGGFGGHDRIEPEPGDLSPKGTFPIEPGGPSDPRFPFRNPPLFEETSGTGWTYGRVEPAPQDGVDARHGAVLARVRRPQASETERMDEVDA